MLALHHELYRKYFRGLDRHRRGRKHYLEYPGTNMPTVVLVSGLVAASDTWRYVTDSSGNLKPSGSAVYAEVGRFTRVCSYEHSGTARENGTFTTSTAMPQPSTP